ncbi:MAG TPA: ribokinase [Anaerolineaceae bacterium]|nr:ribokinase [Anaerolineaceae bacterium]
MKTPPDVIVVGAHSQGQLFKIERMPYPGETISSKNYEILDDGGKGSNQAIALGRLDVETAFIGKIGNDQFGNLAEKWLKEAGVNTDGLIWSNHLPTSTGIIFLERNGINSIINGLGASQNLTCKEVQCAMRKFSGAKILLTGFEIPVDVALFASKLGKKMGMTTVVNPGPAPEDGLGILDYVDILIPNETEAKIIAFGDPLADVPIDTLATKIIEKYHVGSVVITLGENGCFCISSNGSWRFDAIPSKVIDTTGAGDAFCAGIVSGIFQGFDLYSACAWATCVASISVETLGTIPSFPKLEEVKKKFGSIAKNFIRINKYHNKHKEDCDDL